MAKNKSTVYLGYEDEEITEKHLSLLNSTLNKIGGTADWPNGEIKIPACPLCSTARPLIVQLYAPLEMSQFHRTLYVFACLNPACSQNSNSWLCVRTQHLDTPDHCDIMKVVASSKNSSGSGGGGGAGGKHKKKKEQKQQTGKISWCTGTDDWGDEPMQGFDSVEQMDTEADEPNETNEENGNVIDPQNVNLPLSLKQVESDDDAEDEKCLANEEDDEDESNSMDNDLLMSFNQMDVKSGQNLAEDPNANCAGGIAAAAASMEKEGNYACSGASATICAEIEGPENDVVLVETPQKPERDLIALLKHTPTPAALGPLAKLSDLTLKPYFIAVDVEVNSTCKEFEHYGGSLSSEHIRELYQEYKKQDESANSPNSGVAASGSGGGGGGGIGGPGTPEDQEGYEKALPAHGDLMFHNFLSTIQQNPGQVLRYSRDTLPLLISTLQESIPKCPNCNGDTICEIQILSTLIPKLKMQQTNERAPLEYGNVLIFTCLKSCWDTPDKMRYEKVIVQAEK